MLVFVTHPGWLENLLGTGSAQLHSLTTESSMDSGFGSVGIRLNLVRNCLVFLGHSFGFGVGAGNAEYYMQNFSVYDTQGITNPHNWWGEILTDYGLFIFVGYVLIYMSILYNLWRMRTKLSDGQEKMICEALLVGLVIFFFASMSSSSIMAFTPQWLFFAFALGFLNYCRIRQQGCTL
jgi:teichuronic acid biosynthesis protein TuaE